MTDGVGGVVLPGVGNALQQFGKVVANLPGGQFHGVGQMLQGVGAELGTTGSVIDGYTDGNSDAVVAVGIAVGAIAALAAAPIAGALLTAAGAEAMLTYGVAAELFPWGTAAAAAIGATLYDSLGSVDKFEPVSGGCEMDHAEEAAGQLVVTCGDGAVDLEVAEHALDAVALLVEGPVMLDLHPAV